MTAASGAVHLDPAAVLMTTVAEATALEALVLPGSEHELASVSVCQQCVDSGL